MDTKACCGSDCVGCETFAKLKAAKSQKLKKKKTSAEDILWNR